MGACTSTKVKQIGADFNNPRIAKTSARSLQNHMKTLAMRDIKGFKKSDSVENFYDITGSIGRGNLNYLNMLFISYDK
jgi:hypothetical protein